MNIIQLIKEDLLLLFSNKKTKKSIDERIQGIMIRIWFLGIINTIIGLALVFHFYKI